MTISHNFSQHRTSGAKPFFVAKALLELAESSFSLLNAGDDLTGLAYDSPELPVFMISQRTNRSKEQLACNRRLFELFLCLVHFDGVEEHFFDHFLCLTEMDQLLGKRDDDRDFFGKHGSLVQNKINSLKKTIEDLERLHPDVLQAWYLNERYGAMRANQRFRRPGQIFNSQRQRLLALENDELSSFQKLSIGFSYGSLYGHSSKSIHFTGSQAFGARFADMMSLGADVMLHALLCVCVLRQVAQLTGKDLQCLDRNLRALEEQTSEITNRMFTRFEIGDLVIADGGLAIVTDEKTGRFEYRTYEVEFLEDEPVEKDDNYLPTQLVFFASRTSFTELLLKNAGFNLGNTESLTSYLERSWPEPGVNIWKFIRENVSAGNLKVQA